LIGISQKLLRILNKFNFSISRAPTSYVAATRAARQKSWRRVSLGGRWWIMLLDLTN